MVTRRRSHRARPSVLAVPVAGRCPPSSELIVANVSARPLEAGSGRAISSAGCLFRFDFVEAGRSRPDQAPLSAVFKFRFISDIDQALCRRQRGAPRQICRQPALPAFTDCIDRRIGALITRSVSHTQAVGAGVGEKCGRSGFPARFGNFVTFFSFSNLLRKVNISMVATDSANGKLLSLDTIN